MNINLVNRHHRRREKVFGDGRPRPMSRELKMRLMAQARALMRPLEPGKHYGLITAKYMQVLRSLLFDFHNAVTGKCFPSYESIAEKAHCDRSTVHKAIIALETAGLLTWLHRIKRVYEAVTDMFGGKGRGSRSRVLRTSNGYIFSVPPDVKSSESKISTGTTDQDSFPYLARPAPVQFEPDNPLHTALMRLGKAISDQR